MARSKDYKEFLIEKLKNPIMAMGYLNAILDDCKDRSAESQRLLKSALSDIAQSQGFSTDFMKYHFKIHKERDVYWAQGIELKGCITQAKTLRQLNKNMKEALNLYIKEPYDDDYDIPLPNESIKKTRNVVEVPVHILVSYDFLARYLLKKIINGIGSTLDSFLKEEGIFEEVKAKSDQSTIAYKKDN